MDKNFKYTLLKYRPSYVLNEQVNIGILFIFIDDCNVQFTFPKNLTRLSALFPDTDLTDIKLYLSAFQSKANKLCDKNLFIKTAANNFIETEFFLADANCFYFSDFKVGIYESAEKMVTHFSEQYFEYYNTPFPSNRDASTVSERKNDDYLVRKFAQSIKNSEKNKLFRKEILLKTENITANFDYCWQNGTTNFVKSLSFDLKHKETIQRKSALCWAEMMQLQLDNQTQNRRFDFLVLPPTDKALFKPYENALKLLDNLKIETKIVTESDMQNYTEEAIETIIPLELELF